MSRVALSEKDIKALTDFLGSVSKDPLEFVRLAFPWGEPNTQLEDKEGPDIWQIELLNDIKEGLKTPDQVIREAVASGHGIGKSAMVAWIILWAISTHEDTKGVVTANTDTQLKTKTWAELAKWYYLFIAKDLFTYSATSIYSNQEGHEKTWRIDAIPWNDSNPAAFAGLHNQGKRILLIFDEASEIEDVIWEVAEGAMTDSDTELLWLVFGNPTKNIGRFADCLGKERHRWHTRKIDSRTVEITNKQLLNEWIETYGLESDFVKVRILGEPPSSSELQFIGRNVIEAAQSRSITGKDVEFAPAIIGVDPAWGGKDAAVIYLRKGNLSKLLYEEPKSDDNFAFAEKVALFEDKYKAQQVNIDFGYGQGIYSAGKYMGRNWHLVNSSATASKTQYANKRMEMWDRMKQWLINGGCLDELDREIAAELMMPEAYVNDRGQLQLQRKRDMPFSPNRADALALTFGREMKVSTPALDLLKRSRQQGSARNYNPLAKL